MRWMRQIVLPRINFIARRINDIAREFNVQVRLVLLFNVDAVRGTLRIGNLDLKAEASN